LLHAAVNRRACSGWNTSFIGLGSPFRRFLQAEIVHRWLIC